jgi:uncharacterized protein YeaO (DUF488 family)
MARKTVVKRAVALVAAKKRASAGPAAAKRRPTARKPATSASRQGKTVIRVARTYDVPGRDDGMRILIDRLWPRGMRKEALKLDVWTKALSPSNGLRKWYEHDPAKFAEFRKRYKAELKEHGDGLAALREAIKGKTVTLLTSTKELDLSHATVLRELLQAKGR